MSAKWYFTKDQLLNCPSRKHGYDPDKELSCRQQAANFIQELGQRLQVKLICINTAIVYMHRFYAFHSFGVFNRFTIGAAALFLAAKVEEQARKAEYVIKAAQVCLQRDGLDMNSPQYLDHVEELLFSEHVLLQTMGFDLTVHHPHGHVLNLCNLVKAPKDLAQTSYFMASYCWHLTMMCLQYSPTVVACVCVYIACKWSQWEIPKSKEGKDWFLYIDKDVTMPVIEKITDEFLDVLKKTPSKFRNKTILSCQGGKQFKIPGVAEASGSCITNINIKLNQMSERFVKEDHVANIRVELQNGTQSRSMTPLNMKLISHKEAELPKPERKISMEETWKPMPSTSKQEEEVIDVESWDSDQEQPYWGEWSKAKLTGSTSLNKSTHSNSMQTSKPHTVTSIPTVSHSYHVTDKSEHLDQYSFITIPNVKQENSSIAVPTLKKEYHSVPKAKKQCSFNPNVKEENLLGQDKKDNYFVPNVKKDCLSLPNIKKDNSFVSNVKKDHSFVSNVKKDHSFVSNVKKDHSFVSNVKKESSFVPNVKKDNSYVSNVKNDHSFVSNVKRDNSFPPHPVSKVHKEYSFVSNVQKEYSVVPHVKNDYSSPTPKKTAVPNVKKQLSSSSVPHRGQEYSSVNIPQEKNVSSTKQIITKSSDASLNINNHSKKMSHNLSRSSSSSSSGSSSVKLDARVETEPKNKGSFDSRSVLKRSWQESQTPTKIQNPNTQACNPFDYPSKIKDPGWKEREKTNGSRLGVAGMAAQLPRMGETSGVRPANIPRLSLGSQEDRSLKITIPKNKLQGINLMDYRQREPSQSRADDSGLKIKLNKDQLGQYVLQKANCSNTNNVVVSNKKFKPS